MEFTGQNQATPQVIGFESNPKSCRWEPWGHANICAHHNWHIRIPVGPLVYGDPEWIDTTLSQTCPTLPVERYYPFREGHPLSLVFVGRAEWVVISETVRYLRMYGGWVQLLITSAIDPNIGIYLNQRPVIKVGVIFAVTSAPPGVTEGNVQISANTGFAQNFQVFAPEIREEEWIFDTGVPSGPSDPVVPLTQLNFAVSGADLQIKYIDFAVRPA